MDPKTAALLYVRVQVKKRSRAGNASTDMASPAAACPARLAAAALDSPGAHPHDVRVATHIAGLVERFYAELWNRWNDAAVDGTLGPAFTFRGSLGLETSGRQGWRRYRDVVRSGSADFHNEIVELVCDGERAAARLHYTGTHTGVLLGLPATQRRFEYAGAAFFTADHRWLTSAWVLGDLDGLRHQLRWPD